MIEDSDSIKILIQQKRKLSKNIIYYAIKKNDLEYNCYNIDLIDENSKYLKNILKLNVQMF